MRRSTLTAVLSGGALALGASLLAGRNRRSMAGDVVLITGGSRGLGLQLAREFSGEGCRIAICARHENQLSAARDRIAAGGAPVLACQCDVSDPNQVAQMVGAVKHHYGRIDTLVANAGLIRVAPFDNLTVSDFEDAMATMFWGVVHPTLAVLPGMLERGSGRIAVISSVGGKLSVPHLLPYCCAKHAAVAFGEGLRAEVASRGVKVTTIAPGLMRTGSYRKAEFKGQHSKEASWFSLGAALPLISMDAGRAARQIVAAVRDRKSEKILTAQASFAARVNGMFPGFVPDVLAWINRALPAATNDRETVHTGASNEDAAGSLFRAFTSLGRRAAADLNEMTG